MSDSGPSGGGVSIEVDPQDPIAINEDSFIDDEESNQTSNTEYNEEDLSSESEETEGTDMVVTIEKMSSSQNDYLEEDFESRSMTPEDEQDEEDLTGNEDTVEVDSRSLFQCMVCQRNFISQVEFFLHLKSHYEPKNKKTTVSRRRSTKSPKPELNFPETERKNGRKVKPALTIERWDPEIEPSSEPVELQPDITIELVREHPIVIPKPGSMIKPRPPDLNRLILAAKKIVKLEPTDGDEESAGLDESQTEVAAEPVVERFVPLMKPPKKPPKEVKPKRKSPFKRIQLEKHGPFKYECDICKNLFGSVTSLKVHHRIHRGEKPYKCEVCGKDFRQHSDMYYHRISVHTDLKAYQCEFCGKEFSRKYSLTIHRKIHTGVRDYVCEICSMGFRAAIYLSDHRRIHSGERPFLCDICGKGFRIKYLMHRHRRNVHFKGDKVAAKKSLLALGGVVDEDVGDDDEEGSDNEVDHDDADAKQDMHRLVFGESELVYQGSHS